MTNAKNVKRSHVGKIFALIVCGVICIVLAVMVINNIQESKKTYSDYISDEYITLGEYKGLKCTKEKAKISDDEIKQLIDSELMAHSEKESQTRGIVKDGDTVIITYEGKVNGKPIDNKTVYDAVVTIGNDDNLVPGFTKKLIGREIGERFKFELKLPEKYLNNIEDKSVAGKTAVFEGLIQRREEETKPEYDDEFVREYTDYESTEEYEEALRKMLLDDHRKSDVARIKNELLAIATNNAKVKKLPATLLRKKEKLMLDQYKSEAEKAKMTWNDYLDSNIGSTEAELRKEIRKTAEDDVKTLLVCNAIAEKEGISISDKEYEKQKKALLEAAETKDNKEFREKYGMSVDEYCRMNDVKDYMLQAKVTDYVYQNASFKTK